MTQVVKVFTPIKRVPTMIGKAQNGQKLPFGPYTLPQMGGAAVLILITSACTMSLPTNPAMTFAAGAVVTVLAMVALRWVPYTGVRMTSRVLWIARLIVQRKPVYASGVPVDADSARHIVLIEEDLVVLLPDARTVNAASERIGASAPVIASRRMLEALETGIDIDTESQPR